VLNVTIDGVEVEVPEGSNIVKAAARAGIEIPTYCYHPGLSVVGQCRVCFVEIEGAPRLATACSTPVREGMVVLTNSERVREAREAVLEFLLANHPLDCPVCDQAGECLLQDYSVEHGSGSTHMVEEKRRYPGREHRELGPRVIQNQNRCIHCTRCIRFTREISETGDLTMKKRGNHSFIGTFNDEPFDNPWSVCVTDVCPVGALTEKDFRFSARVWHLDESPSICPGCSIGCAITVGSLDGEIKRFKPRLNSEINGWWLCDFGRSLASEQNLREIRRPSEGEKFLSWPHAVNRISEVLHEKDLRIVASANLSNEALYLVQKVFQDALGLEVAVPIDPGPSRKIKNSHGRWIDSLSAHPNSSGATLIGLKTVDVDGLKEFTSSGTIVLLDTRAHPWLTTPEAEAHFGSRLAAAFGRRLTPAAGKADLVLPSTAWTETEGSYTSSTGRVQWAPAAHRPGYPARPMWRILSDIAANMDLGMQHQSPEDVFRALAAEVPAFAGMSYRRLRQESGLPVLEEVSHVG